MEMRKRVHSQTTTCGEPVNVLIHCRMGKIRMIQPDLTFPTLNTLNISISDLKITHILYFLLYRSKSVGRHCRLGHGLSLPHDPQPCGSPCSSSSITIVRHRSSNWRNTSKASPSTAQEGVHPMGKRCLDRPQSQVIYTGIPSVLLLAVRIAYLWCQNYYWSIIYLLLLLYKNISYWECVS